MLFYRHKEKVTNSFCRHLHLLFAQNSVQGTNHSFLMIVKKWILLKVFCKVIPFFIIIYSDVYLQNSIFAKKKA